MTAQSELTNAKLTITGGTNTIVEGIGNASFIDFAQFEQFYTLGAIDFITPYLNLSNIGQSGRIYSLTNSLPI